MCSAVYDFTSEILREEQPAQAKFYGNLANGAGVAVAMTFVESMISDIQKYDSDVAIKERFSATWEHAKRMMQEIPNTQRTKLLAFMEVSDTFFESLGKIVRICMKNGESQQMYVDSWRDLASSGLLTIPFD